MSKNDRHDEDTSVSVIDYTLEVFDLSFVSESQQFRQIYFSMLYCPPASMNCLSPCYSYIL